MEKENPLYYEAEGLGYMDAYINVGQSGFNVLDSGMFRYKREIAKLKGATLRYTKDRDTCDLKVYHPTAKDIEGDTCSIAVYDFYNLHLSWSTSATFTFEGLLTKISHHPEGVDLKKDEYDGYPYLPPAVKTSMLPLAVEVTMVVVRTGEDE